MKILFFISLLVISLSRGTTFAELQQKLMTQLTSPLVSLTFVYDGGAEMGPLMKEAIEDIANRKEGYFKVIAIDCDTDDEDLLKNFPYCSGQIRSKLPVLFFTEPLLNPSSGEEPKNHVYQGNLQQKSLYQFAIPLMKLYSLNLKKSSDWQSFKQTYPETPKVLYFTDKDKISPFYKSLTANFRNTIAFAHIFKNSSLCQQFGITSFPTLLLNGKTQIKMTTNLLQQIEILRQYEGPQANIIIEEIKEAAQSLNQDNLQQKIYENPRHILVHIPDTDGKPHNEWKKCQDSFKKMFDYYQTQDLATKFGVKHRPAIVYFPKSLAKKDLKKTVFYPSDSFRTIYDQVSGLIQDFTVPVSSDLEFQQLTSIHLKEGKLIAVLFHKQDISLSYRVLSNDDRFKEEISFIRMKDPAPDVLAKFQLKKLPALFIMTTDKSEPSQSQPKKKEKTEGGKQQMKLQLAQFTGRFNYDELETYLNYFTNKQDKKEEAKRQIAEYSTKRRFDSGCVEQSCYLLLLDGSPQKEQSNHEYINTLKKSMGSILQNIGYIDGKCHSQILSKLQIYAEQLPVLVYLNSKFEKYTRLIGRIEQKSIESFTAKVKGNKGIWRAYDKLAFEKKNCEDEHQRLKELENSSYQMSAEEAAILEEIKKQQEIKKEQAQIGDKSSKKRRKKRRPQEEDSDL